MDLITINTQYTFAYNDLYQLLNNGMKILNISSINLEYKEVSITYLSDIYQILKELNNDYIKIKTDLITGNSWEAKISKTNNPLLLEREDLDLNQLQNHINYPQMKELIKLFDTVHNEIIKLDNNFESWLSSDHSNIEEYNQALNIINNNLRH